MFFQISLSIKNQTTLYMEIPVTDAAQENLRVVLLKTCRIASGTNIQISQKFSKLRFLRLSETKKPRWRKLFQSGWAKAKAEYKASILQL